VSIILWRKREKFRLGSNFKAWAFKIAKLEVKAHLRNIRKNITLASDPELLELFARELPVMLDQLRRNSCPAGRYCAGATGKLAASRAAAASCRASRTGAQRWAYVERRLTEDLWSPEQISRRMETDGFKPLSHEAIYQYVLRDKAGGGSLHTRLRHKFRSYRRRGSPRERRCLHLIYFRVPIQSTTASMSSRERASWRVSGMIGWKPSEYSAVVSIIPRRM